MGSQNPGPKSFLERLFGRGPKPLKHCASCGVLISSIKDVEAQSRLALGSAPTSHRLSAVMGASTGYTCPKCQAVVCRSCCQSQAVQTGKCPKCG